MLPESFKTLKSDDETTVKTEKPKKKKEEKEPVVTKKMYKGEGIHLMKKDDGTKKEFKFRFDQLKGFGTCEAEGKDEFDFLENKGFKAV